MPEARSFLSQAYRLYSSFIGLLIQPAPILTDPEARQQSRLLLALLITFQVLGGVILLFEAWTHPSALDDFDYLLTLGIWLAGFGLYVWARRGHINGPATILIALLFVLFAVAPYTPDSLTSLPFYIVIPLFMTALFFPIRWTIQIMVLALVVPTVLALTSPLTEVSGQRTLINDALFVLPIGCMLLVYLRHRGAIERIRRAALQAAYDRALASEAELEQRVEERTRALREARQRYYALFEQTHDAVFILDLEGRHLETNSRATDMLGYSAAELNDLTALDLSAEVELSEQVHARLLAGEQVPLFERLFRRKDGRLLPVEINVELVRDLDGRPLHIQSVARDISERKQIEAELRASHADLDHFFTLALDLLCIADTDGHFVKVNKAWESILGYSVEELRGRRFLDFVHPDDLQATLDTIARLVAQQPVFNFTNRYRASDGGYRYIEWRSYPVGKRIYAAARDITERIQAEEALRQGEERLNLTLQSTQAGTWEWNVQTGETLFNDRWAEIVGYTLAELTPISIQTWIDLVHPEDLQTSNRLLEKHFAGESALYECEVRMKHKAGHWVWIWDRGKVMEWTEDHRPLRMFGTHTDITARKEAERHAFELALEKERVHLLSQFIQKASHEFRTPLSIINSNVFLMGYPGEPETLQGRITAIKDQVRRMTRLVETLLMMSKLESGTAIELAQVNMAALIDGVCQRMVSQYGYTPLLRYDIPPDLPSLMGNAEYLQAAIQQILDNAYRFTPAGGTITVTAGTITGYLWLDVQDTGLGIAEADLPRIFETFWRQDEAHTTPGLGLGLPIAQKIIATHGGTLQVRSAIGQGTTIRIILPMPK